MQGETRPADIRAEAETVFLCLREMQSAQPTHDTLNYHFAQRVYGQLEQLAEELARSGAENAEWAFGVTNPFAWSHMYSRPSLERCAALIAMRQGRPAWDEWVSLVLRELGKADTRAASFEELLVVLAEMGDAVRRPKLLTPRPQVGV